MWRATVCLRCVMSRFALPHQLVGLLVFSVRLSFRLTAELLIAYTFSILPHLSFHKVLELNNTKMWWAVQWRFWCQTHFFFNSTMKNFENWLIFCKVLNKSREVPFWLLAVHFHHLSYYFSILLFLQQINLVISLMVFRQQNLLNDFLLHLTNSKLRFSGTKHLSQRSPISCFSPF